MTTKLESDVKQLHVAGAMRTDVGRVRSANEDELIESALGAGGYHNISAGVFCIVETEPIKTNNQAATKSIPAVETDTNASAPLSHIIVPLNV
jgi:hypothetical protein